MMISIDGAVETHEGDLNDLRDVLLGLRNGDVAQVEVFNRTLYIKRADVSFVRRWLLHAEQFGWPFSAGSLTTTWIDMLTRDERRFKPEDVIDKASILFLTLQNKVQ